MYDSSSDYIPQLVYTEEVTTGFRTYVRKYFSNLSIDDPKHGVYVQERDECMNILSESKFLSVADLPIGIYHPNDYLYFYPSLNKDYFWINFDTVSINFNIKNRTYTIYKPKINLLLGNTNFIELKDNIYCLGYDKGGVTILDSQFQVISKFRALYSPIKRLDSGRLFFHFQPYQLPLFAEDSSIILSDIDGKIHWTYKYPNDKKPFFYDWDFSESGYYLVGSADPDGNNVAYNPVVYKLDKQGNFINKKYIETNKFKAAFADCCLSTEEYLYLAGVQTISRKPKEIWQSFIVKMDADLNLKWKRDIDLDCGPIKSYCRSIKSTKDGGALFTYSGNIYGDTCNPLFIKVDPDGNITSVKNTESSEKIYVFPNPTEGSIRIQGVDPAMIRQVELTDAMGSIHPASRREDQIDIGVVPAGIYFLRVRLEGHPAITRKIVKQ